MLCLNNGLKKYISNYDVIVFCVCTALTLKARTLYLVAMQPANELFWQIIKFHGIPWSCAIYWIISVQPIFNLVLNALFSVIMQNLCPDLPVFICLHANIWLINVFFVFVSEMVYEMGLPGSYHIKKQSQACRSGHTG